MEMTIRDMFSYKYQKVWEQYGDIDIYDDAIDGIAVAFCGGLNLTDEAKKHFEMVLDDVCEISKGVGIVRIDDSPEWRKHQRLLEELFNCSAGYCSIEKYDLFFQEVIFPLTEEEAHQLLTSAEGEEYRPLGKFYVENKDGTYTGIYNEDGFAWTEDFKTYNDMYDWIKED